MTNKTDRILSYLPPTFRALPRPTALYSVADAFGTQLQEAENGLSAVMLSHWVDYADRGSQFIADLACFASLYGLAPRNAAEDVAQFAAPCCPPLSADETVEEFREHLKRYVRTYMEGTVTVQGVLRIVAEALGLHIADDYASMDTWWTRGSDSLTTTVFRGDSAARQLFGADFNEARGAAASAAAAIGKTSFRKGIDLRGGQFLRVRVDGKPSSDIDLSTLGDKPALHDVIKAINKKLSGAIASDAGGRLKLTSPTFGANSRLDVLDVRYDAAPALLGLRPRTYTGRPSTAATVTGQADLSHRLDMRVRWQLQLRIDNAAPIMVDCRGRSPEETGLSEIVDAINKAAGARIASHDGKRVVLVSPTAGSASSIQLVSTGAHDAGAAIFGIGPRSFQGANAKAARIEGFADLRPGVDLRAQHLLQLSVDGGRPVVIDLWEAAADLKAVSATKVRNAINRALGAGVASDNGWNLFLTSTLAGPASKIECGPVTECRTRRFVTRAYITDEAAPVIFGFLQRSAVGSMASAARLQGTVDLSASVDLRTNHLLQIAVNDLPPKEVDLAAGILIPRGATLPEIVNAINTQTGLDIASHDERYLILTSPTVGPASRIGLDPLKTGDARLVLFGPNQDTATGKAPAPATIRGEVDLRKPVNLAARQTLRLAVDYQRPVDIDVAGAAPDVTFLDEIVGSINSVVPGLASATADDRLLLTSGTVGETSSLELLPLRALELIEYPPAPVVEPVRETQHGDQWSITNDGAADSEMDFYIFAPQGEAGVQFVDRAAGTRLRVLDPILSGETMHIRRGGDTGLQVEITDAEGTVREVADSSVLAGTIAAEVPIPFEGLRPLSLGEGATQPATLQLNDPVAPAIVALRAVAQMKPGDCISVSVSYAGSVPSKEAALAGQSGYAGRLQSSENQFYLLNERGQAIFRLLPGTAEPLAHRRGSIVLVGGTVHVEPGALPIIVVDIVVTLFDVTLRLDSHDGGSRIETYEGVSIGRGATPESLPLALLIRPSRLVRAEELDKAELLKLSRGSLELTYMNSLASRFDHVKFASIPSGGGQVPSQADEARFAGGMSNEWAVFDISRFSDLPPNVAFSSFAPEQPDPSVQIEIHWTRYRPGAFTVNLPADLPEQYGARFDHSRFGFSGQKPETYNGVVTEPETDPNWLVHRINARSTVVSASSFTGPVPAGWEASPMPFENPPALPLRGGSATQRARMYLVEEGVPGLIELLALSEGEWGNSIAVTCKRAGTVRFDMTVDYLGARFESGMQIALAGRVLSRNEAALPSQPAQIVKAGTAGVVQAKAAGVQVDVTRDRTVALSPATSLSRLRRTSKPGFPHLAFNGVNSYVEVPDSEEFSVSTTGALTVAAWVRPDTLTFPHDERKGYVNWLGKGTGQGRSAQQEWAFRMYNLNTPEGLSRPNRIGFYLFSPSGGLGIGSYFQDPVQTSEWIHVVGAADGTRTYIYKNGVFRRCDQYRGATDRSCGRHAFIVTPTHGSAPLRMGHVEGSSYFLGGLSEVRFWNRLLTRKEIAGLYGANRVPRDGLVAEYLLNEGAGEVAHDTVGDHDGMIFGAKWK